MKLAYFLIAPSVSKLRFPVLNALGVRWDYSNRFVDFHEDHRESLWLIHGAEVGWNLCSTSDPNRYPHVPKFTAEEFASIFS